MINQDAMAQYLGFMFEYAEQENRVIALRGIGEKGTDQYGKFREQKFVEFGVNTGGDVLRHVERWSEHGLASFIVPATLGQSAMDDQNASEEHLKEFTTLLVDLDDPERSKDCLDHLQSYLGEPSMIVASGGEGKYHVYYRLNEATDDIETVCALRHAMALKVGGDLAFKKGPQVIRLPGSVHNKNNIQNPVEIIATSDQEYDLWDLKEAIEAMPLMDGVAEPVTMDFSTPGPSLSNTMTTPVHEGGTDEHNRWTAFNQVAGHYIHSARHGSMTPEEAKNLAYGWMQANMQPAWDMQRFNTEFNALLNRDIKLNGPLIVPQTSIQREGAISTNDEWNAWSLYKWIGEEKPKRRFLIDGLIMAGAPQLLVAEGGAGKSFLALDLALKVAAYSDQSRGFTWLGQRITDEAKDGTVIFITAEDDLNEIRIRAHDIDDKGYVDMARDRLKVLPLVDAGGSFPLVNKGKYGEAQPSQRWEYLLEQMRTEKKVSLVIIDTLNSTLHGEEMSTLIIQEFFREATRICSEFGAALIITHHVRKGNKGFINSANEMKNAIRGSGAITNSVRAVIGIWHAHDYRRRMEAMGFPPSSGKLYRAAVVKVNNPEMMKGLKTLLRQPSGLLKDVSSRDRLADEFFLMHEAWLAFAIQQAAFLRHPFTRTGSSGLYARRTELPKALSRMTRKELEVMAQKLLESGSVVYAAMADGKKSTKRLDVPGGSVAKGEGYDEAGELSVEWSDFAFDEELGEVLRV